MKTSLARLAEDRVHLGTLLAIVAAGAALRLFFVSQPMHWDESHSFLSFATRPFFVALSDYSIPNNHLFHTLLVRICYLALGNHPWVIRLPALLAGIAIVPACYAATRMLYGPPAALIAAALSVTSYPLVFYSANARGYTLVGLCFLCALILGASLLSHGDGRLWALLAAVLALGIYTVPIMLYPLCALMLWMAITLLIVQRPGGSRRASLRNLFLTLAGALSLALALYSPALIVSGWRRVFANPYVAPHPWPDFVRALPASLAATYSNWSTDVPTVVAWGLAGAGLAALVFHRRLSRQPVPIAMAAVAAILPALIIQRVAPPPRVWATLNSLYLMLSAAGLAFVLRPLESRLGSCRPLFYPAASLILCVWIGFNVIHTQAVYHSPETGTFLDAEAVAVGLRPVLHHRDCVRTNLWPSYWPLRYYFLNHEVPVRYLDEPPSACGRLVLVVQRWGTRSVDSILAEAHWPEAEFGPPREIGRCGTTLVYEMQRLD